MKLLRVIRDTKLESGGPIEGLLRTSEHLLQDGHQVEVVSLEPEDVAASRGFHVPVIGLGAGIGKYGYNPRLTSWVKENAARYDAVVLHGLWNYSSVGSWRGLRQSSTPFYIYTHGMMDPWFRQQYPLKHLAKQAYWWLEGRVLSDAQAVLFTSEEERLRARGVFLGHTYNERVVRYGASGPPGEAEKEIAAFYDAYPALKEKPFLLFLGRIHPKKGCDILIQAFKKSAKGMISDLELAMAGPDQIGWSDELKSLARKLGISDRIHWLGMLKGEHKWGALRTAQAMILPSHQENFGIAVVEAMACSTPVLISRTVNIWQEVVRTNGGFAAADTEQGTIELIERFCLLTGEERAAMRAAAREGFLQYFEVEAASKDFARAVGFTNDLVRGCAPPRGRILQVIHDTNPQSGGPIEALTRISEVLSKDGYDCTVLTLEQETELASRDLPFRVHALGPGVGRYGYNPRLVSWLRRNASKFDAVILHGLWNYSSFGSWRALRKTSTPYFIYSHGMMDLWFRNRYPFKHIVKQIYWLLAEGRVLRDAAEVLFTCEEEKSCARKVFQGYSYRGRVMPFGTTDPAGHAAAEKRAFRSTYPALSERRFLLFLGRIHPKKACDLLIRAFASCIEQIPHDLDLVFAGPDQIGWSSELKDLAKALEIESRTHWLGMLQGELKWGAIRSAEAIILPSHQENFGIVVAESMACSTPVLISNRVNIWREVTCSKAGLVQPDTVEGIRNLICSFIALSSEDRDEMRSAARQGFLTHFSIDVTASDLLELLKTMKKVH